MRLYILALLALFPFAIVGLLYREADIDMRQGLVSVAAILAVVAVVGGLLFFED
ncbi:hypothetical protein BH11PSE3_BH11PSE3_39160 [soil metagenome]